MIVQILDEKAAIEKLINSDTEDVDEDSEWIKRIKDETSKTHLREGNGPFDSKKPVKRRASLTTELPRKKVSKSTTSSKLPVDFQSQRES